MAKAKKSYSDLQAEIDKLLKQQEALKDEKLDVFIKEFQKKDFQEKLLNVDDKVLKQVAKSIVKNFDSMVSQVKNTEKQPALSQPTSQQNTTPFVEPTSVQ